MSMMAEALALIRAAGRRRWKGRVRGLVRVGERRWDVVLDREQRILLPEHRRRCRRFGAGDRARAKCPGDVLGARSGARVDLCGWRQRPTVRMNEKRHGTNGGAVSSNVEGRRSKSMIGAL